MANAFKMREYRHARFRLNAFDQAFSASRNHYVNAFRHAEHFADRGPVRCRDSLNGRFRKFCMFESCREAFVKCLRSMETIGTASQN